MRKNIVPRLIFCLLIGMLSEVSSGIAQMDTISGIVNYYTPVLGIDTCNNILSVANSSGFAVNDDVLIIQMQGAAIDTDDNSGFGETIDYKDAGNYEFAKVKAVWSNTLILDGSLLRHYTISGKVQVIRVPRYLNVVADGVDAQIWDGRTGGVVAVIVDSKLELIGGGIMTYGVGFPGGRRSTNAVAEDIAGYIYTVDDTRGAGKGDGISLAKSAFWGGRGRIATGRGGGKARACGGGGGGNYGAGGKGGYQAGDTFDGGGVGGEDLIYSNVADKVFMGGGGGGGMAGATTLLGLGESFAGADGCRGGGIIIVKADTIYGNDRYIAADGRECGHPETTGGLGGGGAGGTVLLEVNTYIDDVNVWASGGSGGRVRVDTTPLSPGGGGGGGVIWISGGSIPVNMTAVYTGGAAGTVGITYDPARGAEDGDDGGVITGLDLMGNP